MAINWVYPVRGLQATLAVVVLGLMAYVAQWWSSHWRQLSPSEVNFLIFAPVWTLVAIPALIVVPWKLPHLATSMGGKIGLLALEVLTMIYWLAGFIALAVFLSDRICFGQVCSVAKAGIVLSAFEWVAMAVTTVFAVLRILKGGLKGASVKETKTVEMHQGV
ncbi:hypothetical protein P154DRAFT_618604 [Amniculicola lignicola CBS 123094]|uniref:MARVEL domain-containing protein n=1 Tax=Amniculicola lignicola CBS 123094 TaxID=1392246 RepID=A0A6A5WQR9_9PLEO|nr:hypothetical protein P154DRAFT_618604 [Amniculicola lignicola CBS 123094]